MRPITHIVIHYSATYPDQDTTAADIDRMHRAEGFAMIGYHYFIRRNGQVERGRPLEQVGAHCRGHNETTIGICCAGGIDRKTGPTVGVDNRSPQQVEAQIQLIHHLLQEFPNAKVVGHRDLVATQCPGFDVIPWWQQVLAAEALPPAASTGSELEALVAAAQVILAETVQRLDALRKMHR